MTDPVPLLDPDLLAVVLRLEPELYQVAQWTELLKGEIDAGTMQFPIDSLDDLQPLLDRAAQVPLEPPRTELIPGSAFPVADYPAFARSAYALILFEHKLSGQPPPPKVR